MESDPRLDNKSRMSREVHVRFREGLGPGYSTRDPGSVVRRSTPRDGIRESVRDSQAKARGESAQKCHSPSGWSRVSRLRIPHTSSRSARDREEFRSSEGPRA
jgi:hypothetical protein